jgi:methionyl-tRNA formyltransferase|tara:strand:+ start:86 stop:226 length:141 start_codon:yes stop_codon:yes gene_type:complete
MDEGIDSGEILSQKNFNILSNNDARILYDKLVNIALQQIEEFLPQL